MQIREKQAATMACLQVIRNGTRRENIKIAVAGSFFLGRDCGSIYSIYVPFSSAICLVPDKGKLCLAFIHVNLSHE